MINELAQQIYENAKSKGFYDDGKATNMGERLALINSEVSEALEADRKGRYANLDEYDKREKQIVDSYNNVANGLDNQDFEILFKNKIKDTFQDELADIVIRCLDTAAFKGIDLKKHIELKMRYNSLREMMHGKKY